uniref:Uncharacterized protein n=4 Tax=Hemiselmis andersenii TaxID=464988 RepID=A0A7S1ECE9_HEMAN
MEEHLEGLCRMAGLGLSDCLDRKWQLVVSQGSDNAYKSSSHSSLFFATHAVTACMSRCRTQAFVFLVSVVLLSVSACSAAMFSFNTGKYAFGPYKHFRLETMLTRNGSVGREITSPGISTFGIIGSSRCTSAGSTIPMGARREDHSHHFVPAAEDSDIVEPSFTVSVGTSAIVSYAKGRGMAGWYFDTPGSMGVGGDGMDGMDQSADASMGHDHEADPSMGQGMDFATVLDQHPAYFNVWATNEDFDISEPSCALGRETGEWWEGGDESRWCGATWKRVGAPLWRYRGGLYLSYNRNETRYWDFVQLPIELSTSEEGSREVFVLPPAYGESLWTHVFAPFFQGSCFLLACIVARLGDRFKLLPPSNLVLAAGSLLAAFFNFIGVFYAASSGLAHLAVEQALKGGSTMILFATFYWQGPRFVYGLWAYSVADAVTWGIMCYWLFHDAFARLAIASLLTLCHALPISLLRIYHLRHSKLLLRGDQVQYDALWESLCRSEDGLACIQHLRKVVEMIGLDKDNYCRQLNRQRADRLSAPLKEQYISMAHTQPIHHIFWDIRHWCMPNRPDKESGVSSFNQLFTASSVANLLLCDLVQSWAHRCEGMFMVEDGEDGSSDARFMKWVDILRHRPEYIPRVRRCTMKRHSRAMEKLLRSYGNNPSHLLDVARGCIVFESLAQLTNCLGVMITDSNVRVERIKNRLDIEYDSDESAGYRDVCINLRVINKTAQALGAELHVCEVQLLTLEFAKLKTADGHKRYVQSRNDRGT